MAEIIVETPTMTARLTPELVSTLADIYAYIIRQPQSAKTVAVEAGALIVETPKRAEAHMASQLQ